MGDKIGALMTEAKAGETRAFARLLSVLESVGPSVLATCPELTRPSSVAFRVGITGPPGAGKSTLINRLIGVLRSQGKRVGVIAVDPSSPFTKGAVLGDRIRYQEHFSDPGVFIRSLGSRGSYGGLSASAYLMVRAFDCAGFDVVLIETVGVGQTELEIMNVADWVGVVLVPESGDSIQAMKAGLLEIANVFVVNKSDRPGAEGFRRELEASIQLDPRAPSEPVEVLSTVAVTGVGVDDVVDRFIRAERREEWKGYREDPDRIRSEAMALLRASIEREAQARLVGVSSSHDLTALFAERPTS